MQAAAVNADETQRVFASLGYGCDGGFHYHAELARRRVVSVDNEPLWSETELKRVHPYVWEYYMAPDREFANLGSWACARLTGRPAAHAGGAEQNKPRTFGIYLQNYWLDQRLTADALDQQLTECGSPARYHYTYATYDSPSPESDTNVVLQMRQAGITSVFCLCQVFNSGTGIARASTVQSYYPEWLMNSYGQTDMNAFVGALWPAEHLAHSFGLTFMPKQVAADQRPAVWALREADPAFNPSAADNDLNDLDLRYRDLLLLASGLQMAGPILTAETFEQGLHRTRFPNPDTPQYAGHVGFGNNDHTMTDDAAEIWWSGAAIGPNSRQQGSYCYVDHGARRALGDWPTTGDPFFTGPCDNGGAGS